MSAEHYAEVLAAHCARLAFERGLLNGDERHDCAMVARLVLHFSVVAA